MRILAIFAITCLLLGGAGCSPTSPEKQKDKVVLQLKWVHQAQFAGFYLAKVKGFYEAEHLEVAFLEGGKDIDQCDQLINGVADFAITGAETVILKRGAGVPVTALAVMYQRSAVAFAAKADSGIVRPVDFIGRTIAVGGTEVGGFVDAYVQFKALMGMVGVAEGGYSTVPYDPGYADFLGGKADISPAYLTGGVIKLRSSGTALNLIWPGDYGINFYCDTLIAREDYWRGNQEIALRFLRASLKGWQYAIEHSEEAVDATMAYARVKDRSVQMAMHNAQIPLIHTGIHPLGHMDQAVWQSMHNLLREQHILSQSLDDVKNVYTLDLLNALYPAARQ